MENENNYTVYMHVSPSGKVYIGITKCDPFDRWKNGLGYLNKNQNGDYRQPAIARAIIKYGWDNFKHEILFEGLTKDEAEGKEILLISHYQSNNPAFGYNIRSGGSSSSPSDETRLKMSESGKGRIVSSETREKLRKASTGKISPRRKAVLCVETDVVYCSQTEAGKIMGINPMHIGGCCRGERKTAGGFHWKYA